ncbi:MAG: hypothetical protein NTW80_08840 [Deltaproteobacteria bacterium]|nr:hypothetical protein [Deltaproteobacteria bacterium]
MKKTILVLVVLALLVPASAFAATEFSLLGGFIKLDSFWDSTQNNKNSLFVIQRNNDSLNHHGRFFMTAQGSRFNFTIKGPKLWGATTTGFIEMDWDSSATDSTAAGPIVSGTNHPTDAARHVPDELARDRTDVRPVLGHVLGVRA